MAQKVLSGEAILSRTDLERPTFEEVYSEWFHEVSRWARALGGPTADLDDLTQEVFLVARRKLKDFDGANLPAWLYRITQRTVRDYRRSAWFRRYLSPRSARPLEATSLDVSPDPSELCERRQAERLLGALLDQMSEKRRTTFYLFEVEGYSGEEIASLENVPLNTVWTRLYHARKDFFALLAKARDLDGEA